MRSFRSGPASHKATPDNLIRLFQSETAEILATPEPWRVRATLLVMAVMVVSLLATATFITLVIMAVRLALHQAGQ